MRKTLALTLVATLAACSVDTMTATPDGGPTDTGADAFATDASRNDAASNDAAVAPDTGVGCPVDADNDHHVAMSCGGDDCDDNDANRFPANPEVCDSTSHDEDCDPTTLGTRDNDGDGHIDQTCCNVDTAGTHHCGDDCDDSRASVYGGLVEACDSLDNDCDTAVDEGAETTFGADCDGDGYGSATTTMIACAAPSVPPACASGVHGWVGGTTDCDDARAQVHPTAPESCDGLDDDCDGSTDGAPATALCMADPNVTTGTCTAAACAYACATDRLDCTTAPGCETDSTTEQACGSCSNVCAWQCIASSCQSAIDLSVNGGGCAADAGGVLCWGNNDNGQLGDGTTTSRAIPVRVSGLTDVVEVGRSGSHACARHSTGRISCWGLNTRGELGDGTMTSSPLPVSVAGIVDAVEIAVGAQFTCARRMSGAVVCWGLNSQGALGNGTIVDSPSPVAVTGVLDAIAITAGARHACAIRTSGAAVCWGDNSWGQCGNGVPSLHEATPVAVVGALVFTDISAGSDHTCAMRGLPATDVWCWGRNSNGQLGDGSMMQRTMPVQVSIGDVFALSSGDSHTCALRNGTEDDACWGRNDLGQLGDGTTTDRTSPVLISGVNDAVQIGAGYSETCARRPDGTIWCWGTNDHGEVGDGTMTQRSRPVAVAPP